MYYREAVGAILVYDLTQRDSLEAVPYWRADIDKNLKYDDSDFPVVLVGNKIDIADEDPTPKMTKYAKENGYVGFFATSAKENVNVTEAVNLLLETVLDDVVKTETETNIVNLEEQIPEEDSGCC